MNKEKTYDKEFLIQLGIVAILALLLVYNLGRSSVSQGVSPADIVAGIPQADFLPIGVPAIYGSEMGISYDDVSPSNQRLADATISKLTEYEDEVLSAQLLERYIRIGSSISCEYCCGADSIIFSNGARACGCAHSYAMRGLAKYLLIEHGDEFSDIEILEELGKWKVLFFPGIHAEKAAALDAEGIDYTDFVNLASNKYRGIEQGKSVGSSSEMVGGC